ncbi:glycosyltransferase family 2 protein [Singulisphaera sp. Ch08]|uniref:Glycosyltransferase family 2 protein n=1 Tax=Singulisphaera sp. Ch08 TaxID=3120278 RepID=A0AAU7CP64_9BACT
MLEASMRPDGIVSVVVPCRNEAGRIDKFLRHLLTQEDASGGQIYEYLIADGMSDDGTRETIQAVADHDPRVILIDNPDRFVSSGLNAAIRAAKGGIIVRMDVHTEYASNYIKECVDTLVTTGADNVGGPWVARGDRYISRAIAAAFRSPFSAGGAPCHDPEHNGPVDTIYLGCWLKSVFARIGLFDEELVRDQDDEFNLRLVRSGGRLWQSPRIQSWYCPRSSLSALFRQYRQYGYWKVRVIQKHRRPASLRHLVPVLCLAVAATGWVAGLVHWSLGLLYVGLLGFYGLLSLGFSARAAYTSGRELLPILPVVFFLFHAGYALGFAAGLLDFVVFHRGVRPAMTVLTRPLENAALRKVMPP